MSLLNTTRSLRPAGDQRSAAAVAVRRCRARLLALLGRSPTEAEALALERAAQLHAELWVLNKRLADGAGDAAMADAFADGVKRLAALLVMLGLSPQQLDVAKEGEPDA